MRPLFQLDSIQFPFSSSISILFDLLIKFSLSDSSKLRLLVRAFLRSLGVESGLNMVGSTQDLAPQSPRQATSMSRPYAPIKSTPDLPSWVRFLINLADSLLVVFRCFDEILNGLLIRTPLWFPWVESWFDVLFPVWVS